MSKKEEVVYLCLSPDAMSTGIGKTAQDAYSDLEDREGVPANLDYLEFYKGVRIEVEHRVMEVIKEKTA